MANGNFSSWLNTATMPEMSDLIMKQFSHVNTMVPTGTAQQLFIYEDLTSHPSNQKRYDEVDVETFGKLKREGENAQKARANIGYTKTMTARRYAMEIDVSWEFRRYSHQYASKVKADLTSLVHFIPNRTELNLSHIFTFCTSTSYTDMDGETIDLTVGDGLALVSTVHTLTASATTYSNQVSGNPAFSIGALEAAQTLTVTDVYSNFGEKRVLSFKTIVTGDDPTTVKAVQRVLRSPGDANYAHAGVINTSQNECNHVILPYLSTTATGARDATKRRWWFLVAAGQGVAGWQAYFGVFEAANMKSPAAGNNGEDMHNDNWTYGCRGSHGIVVLSGRGLIASCPSN